MSRTVDVLKELENISNVTLRETGVFCSSNAFLDRVAILQPQHVERARERGHLEQRGVLRTNCIDCLDRTNVGQFAVGECTLFGCASDEIYRRLLPLLRYITISLFSSFAPPYSLTHLPLLSQVWGFCGCHSLRWA